MHYEDSAEDHAGRVSAELVPSMSVLSRTRTYPPSSSTTLNTE